MSNELDFLAKVSIFSRMKKTDLKRIAKLTSKHTFYQGDVIIREGDEDRQLFIILDGEVEVIQGMGAKNERRIRTQGPYSYFGEMALIDEMARSASVVATKETKVLSLDHLNFVDEIEKCPAIALEMLQFLSRRIRSIENTLMNALGASFADLR